MTRRIHTFAIVATLCAVCSCQSLMDAQPDDRIESQQSAYEYVARIYYSVNQAFWDTVFCGPAYGAGAGGHMLSGYCDEAQEVQQSSVVYDWYRGKVSASSMPLFSCTSGDLWSNLFQSINECNTGIKYLESEDLEPQYSDELRARFLSQFYAVRAMAYLYLVKRWGGVPIVREPSDASHDYSKDTRASFAQCVDFIFESCDAAVKADPSLSWHNGSPTNCPEISKSTLMAIKSQASLYAASPLWADDCAGTERYTWEFAAETSRAALDSLTRHGCRLVDDSTSFPVESESGVGAYGKYFLSSYPWTFSWDTETIDQPYCYGNLQSVLWSCNGLPLDVGQTSCGCCPTQEMVDAYDVVSEDGTVAVPLLDLSNPYNTDGTPNFNPDALVLGYVDCTPAMYLRRDPRFYGTIWYDGSTATRNGEDVVITPAEGADCGIDFSATNKRNTCTGYYLRKFINADSGADNGNKDGYLRNFRLAEIYLNFAEAACMAYGADEAVGGLTAREAVDAVRARAGLPGITEDGAEFLLRLKGERRVELAFEEHRFFDVRRWSAPDGDLEATDSRVSGILIDASGNYSRFNYERKCSDNKYLKYPLPLSEVRKMLELTGQDWQNEGWN